MANLKAGKTQEGIVNQNVRVWAGTNKGRFYRLAWSGAFATLMICEWLRSPNGSPLLGPLGLLRYNGFDVGSLVFIAMPLAVVFAFLIKPHVITSVISMFGGLIWLFLGFAIQGTGC